MIKCLYCNFFDEITDALNTNRDGECRVNPPATHLVVVPVRTIQGDAMNAQVMTVFPRVSQDKFCGKFSPKLNG